MTLFYTVSLIDRVTPISLPIKHMGPHKQQSAPCLQVLDAYSSGAEAFKQLQQAHGMRPDHINDVMIDLEQVSHRLFTHN